METTINYNGTEIILNGEYVGTATPWGWAYAKQQHKVEIGIDGKNIEFDFYCNDYAMNHAHEIMEGICDDWDLECVLKFIRYEE